MNIKFKDAAHKEFFAAAVRRADCRNDPYRLALFYTLGLHGELRRNIDGLYDFKRRQIIFEGLNAPWQTCGSARATRLAFNLYNGFDCDTGEDRMENGAYYTPYELFCDGNTPYFFEAVKLRYTEYCHEAEPNCEDDEDEYEL